MPIFKKEAQLNYTFFLKAVSAVVIVIYHYRHLAIYSNSWPASLPSPLFNYFKDIYQYGYLVVELFFLLSGFGLINQYLDITNENKYKSLGTFIGKKVLRIYPVFFATTIICTIFQFISYKSSGSFVLGIKAFKLTDIIFSFLLMQTGIFSTMVPLNVPAWFLTPLFLCYIFFWLIFYSVKDKKLEIKILMASTLLIIGAIVLYRGWNVPVFNERIARGLYAFFSGVLLGVACRKIEFDNILIKLLAIFALFMCLFFIKHNLAGNLYLSSVFVHCLLIFLFDKVIFLRRIFSLSAFQKSFNPLAAISYEVFCSHYVILTVIAVIDQCHHSLYIYYDTLWFFTLYSISTAVLSIGMKKINVLVKTKIRLKSINQKCFNN